MSSIVFRVYVVAVLSVMFGRATHAQASAEATTQTSVRTSPPPLMSAGFSSPVQPVDWRRYDFPQMCAHVITRLADSAAGRTIDLLPRMYADTQPTVVIQQAQRCLTQFPWTATTPKRDWDVLFEVAVMAGNDAQVRTMVAGKLDTLPATALNARVKILSNTVSSLMGAKPSRIALARTFMAQVDSLGQGNTNNIEVALAIQAMHDQVIVTPAILAHDMDTWEQEARFAVALWAKFPNDAPGVALPKMTADIQLRKLAFLRTGAAQEFAQSVTADSTTFEMIASLWGHKINTLVGKEALPLAGDFWYGRPTLATSPIKPGVVSLVIFHQMGENVFNDYTRMGKALRTLQARLPTLNIVVVTTTTPVFGNIVLPTMQAAADSVHHYFSDVYRIPGMLSVSQRHTYTLPAPDLRVTSFRSDDEQQWNPAPYGTFLVDPQGRVVSRFSSGFSNEGAAEAVRINAFIERVVGLFSSKASSIIP